MKVKNMNSRLLAVAAVLMAALIVAGLAWFILANVIVGGRVYPRSVQFLNLREEELTIEQYEAIRAKLPDCQLYWSVPFQGSTYPENTTELTITTLSDADIQVLDYFADLAVVDAVGCTDYPQLAALRVRRPELELRYEVTVSGTAYDQDATAVTLTTLSDEEITLLQQLPKLTTVNAEGCDDYAQLEKLKAACPQLEVVYTVKLCGEAFRSDITELTVTGMTDEEAQLLQHMPNLTAVHLVEPTMDAQTLLALPEAYPNASFTWEKSVLGMTVHSDATEIDLMAALSEKGVQAYEKAASASVQGNRDETVWQFAANSRYPLEDMTAQTNELIQQVEDALAYFPEVQQVNMNGMLLDNEAMAAFREAHRQDYKVVWTVKCGTMYARTDTPYFMPYKYGVAYFFDDYTVDLRYCEDIVCIDLGHMSVHDVSFVEYMPKLKYLILAHTQVSDISPLSTCKSLVFLELDWSIVRDYSPLLGCTALEDLNLGKTYADVTPVLQMTWLKHLWFLDRSTVTQAQIREAFEGTDTELFLSGELTVGGGWRELPNYYAMRDALNMDYMKG